MKILWAVDAFDEQSDLKTKALALISRLAARQPVEVTPVYVLSPEQLGLGQTFTVPMVEQFLPAARKALESRLKEVGASGFREPQVIVHHRASLRSSIDTLVGFAKIHEMDLILLGSHGRRGWDRLVIGSFAEEVILRSDVPLMVVGAGSKPVAGLERILFPTDFSESSSRFFDDVIAFAAPMGLGVTLLHVVPRPVEAAVSSGVYLLAGGWVPVPTYLTREREAQTASAREWKDRAARRGIACEFEIDVDTSSVTDSIVRHAERIPGCLIAMAGVSGPVAAALLGSVVRQVLRNAPCPVWVARRAE